MPALRVRQEMMMFDIYTPLCSEHLIEVQMPSRRMDLFVPFSVPSSAAQVFDQPAWSVHLDDLAHRLAARLDPVGQWDAVAASALTAILEAWRELWQECTRGTSPTQMLLSERAIEALTSLAWPPALEAALGQRLQETLGDGYNGSLRVALAQIRRQIWKNTGPTVGELEQAFLAELEGHVRRHLGAILLGQALSRAVVPVRMLLCEESDSPCLLTVDPGRAAEGASGAGLIRPDAGLYFLLESFGASGRDLLAHFPAAPADWRQALPALRPVCYSPVSAEMCVGVLSAAVSRLDLSDGAPRRLAIYQVASLGLSGLLDVSPHLPPEARRPLSGGGLAIVPEEDMVPQSVLPAQAISYLPSPHVWPAAPATMEILGPEVVYPSGLLAAKPTRTLLPSEVSRCLRRASATPWTELRVGLPLGSLTSFSLTELERDVETALLSSRRPALAERLKRVLSLCPVNTYGVGPRLIALSAFVRLEPPLLV